MSKARLAAPVRCAALLTAVVLASCDGGATGAGSSAGAALARTLLPQSGSGSSPIQHVIVLVQENRSFDDLFATFPNANGTTQGLMKTSSGDQYITLKEEPLVWGCDSNHAYPYFLRDYDGGRMDGFNLEGATGKCQNKALAPYQYVNPQDVAPYWDMATQYVLADDLFQTQGSGSFTAHQDLIAAGTSYNNPPTKTLIDYPTRTPWGCDALPATKTSYVLSTKSGLKYRHLKGPFPCMKYSTLRDLLDAAGVSWKYYTPAGKNGTASIWNAFDAIKAVREGSEWQTNVISPQTQIFNDINYGALPAVSWVIPDKIDSDHPEVHSDTGPSWVASVVNAIGESSYWDTSAIVIVWDDWGGFYDHVQPAFFDNWGGLGFRVPMIVISPYALGGGSQNYVSHTQYEFGSIVKFIEDTFSLGSLGKTDARANSISDCFNFYQSPRSFTSFSSKYPRSHFLHERPSGLPVDEQ